MRTSNKGSHVGISGSLHILVAGTLAAAGIVATTATVSKQDIVSLANIRTADSNRWLAHLISIPGGSEHAASSNSEVNSSAKLINHTQAVQTAEDVHLLGQRRTAIGGGEARVNRIMMGDRVFMPKPVKIAFSAQMLLKRDSLIAGSIKSAAVPANKFIAMAQTFSVPTPVVPEMPATIVANLPPEIIKSQMNQAHAASRNIAKPGPSGKRDEIVVSSNSAITSTVSAYAPQDTQMASAFAAVLRPSLRKKTKTPTVKTTRKAPTNSVEKKSSLKKAVAALKHSNKRTIIRLARGDHKWAANPLPRLSYTRNQRRCLAVGVYFEARSESKKGQQAVAQVILNRVKNPTYPNSICGVVYQNKWKRNACQFSFACDGKRDRVKSQKNWRKSVMVANDAIDGRVWLRSVGSSSHYHADYVWPRWRRSMRKMVKIGRHIFYRTYGGGWS